MKHKPLIGHRAILSLSIASAFSVLAQDVFAQGVASEQQLKPVSVTGTRNPLDPNLPNSTDSRTAAELETQNIFNAEDSFRYMPSTTVRKRYIGDRNANVGGRSFGVLEPGRALVYLDGYLISQFLGRFDAPKWNMVNNESIDRVDVMYGPFSAIYPGNSIGTTLLITERKPKGFEASANIRYSQESFKEYGTSDTYTGSFVSARIASKLDSGLWYSVGAQHQDSIGHPMGYTNVIKGAANQFGNVSGTRVEGIIRDLSQDGAERAIFGANTIDHTQQSTLNIRLGQSLANQQELEARVAFWQNKSLVSSQTYLRNMATGAPVWSGVVNDGVNSFSLAAGSAASASQFAPSERLENNRQLGLTWRTKNRTHWNASVVATDYKIVSDVNRQAFAAQPVADLGGAGTATRRDGTGWNTFEIQSTYTPTKDDFGNGNHALVFGLHRNQYTLRNVVNNAADWRNSQDAINQYFKGNTQVLALYAQDAWAIAPDWMLTTGARFEQFQSNNGEQFFSALPVATNTLTYAKKSLTATSPKVSVAWSGLDTIVLKASAAKGVRFANVDELFNGTRTGNTIIVSNPGLQPEVSNALELSAEKSWNKAFIRASLFQDDVKNTILRQTDATVVPSVTRVTNVDRVVTNGIEIVTKANDVLIKGFEIGGSATWVDSTIKANAAVPGSVGRPWLRIPKQRYAMQVSYQASDALLFAANYRFSGRNYNTLLGMDINPETFGGISKVNQLDLKVNWKFHASGQVSAGIDNVNNSKAWQAHTLPLRSLQVQVRYAN